MPAYVNLKTYFRNTIHIWSQYFPIILKIRFYKYFGKVEIEYPILHAGFISNK